MSDVLQSATLLAAECDSGNIEYKWKLLNKSEERVTHLTTQLAYRLSEGGGSCIYELGVLDSGFPEGLSDKDLTATIKLIQRMARTVNAEARVSHIAHGARGLVAEVIVDRIDSATVGRDLHIALVGRENAGKSSLLGLLCTGKLDNGRGSARMNVFNHRHELESGHTQSVSRQLIGFDSAGHITNHRAINNATVNSFNDGHAWTKVAQDAVTIISFYDCVGVASGQKLTLSALLTHGIDYAVFAINGCEGVSELDEEQLATCFALDLPIIIAITKSDQCAEAQLATVRLQIAQTVARLCSKSDCDGVRQCYSVSDSDDMSKSLPLLTEMKVVPIFALSSLTGTNIDLFTQCLSMLPKLKDWSLAERFGLEFSVDSVYAIDDRSIIGGTIVSGAVETGQRVIIGPIGVQGRFTSATVASIHIKRKPVKKAKAGQVTSLALSFVDNNAVSHCELRRGLVVLDGDACTEPHVTRTFTARVRLDSSVASLHVGSQPMIYLPNIRQSVMVLGYTVIPSGGESGSVADLELQFCHSPEFVRPGARCLLTEAGIKAKGAVTEVRGDVTVDEELSAKRKKEKRSRRRSCEDDKPRSPGSADSDELDTEMLERIPHYMEAGLEMAQQRQQQQQHPHSRIQRSATR